MKLIWPQATKQGPLIRGRCFVTSMDLWSWFCKARCFVHLEQNTCVILAHAPWQSSDPTAARSWVSQGQWDGITGAGGHNQQSPVPGMAEDASSSRGEDSHQHRECFEAWQWLWLLSTVWISLRTAAAGHSLELQSTGEHEVGLKLSFLLPFALSAKWRSATPACVIDTQILFLSGKSQGKWIKKAAIVDFAFGCPGFTK